MKKQTRRAQAMALALLTLLTAGASSSLAQAQKGQSKAAAINLAALLEKTGYAYTKLTEGVWEVPFKGNNLKQFGVRVALGSNVVVILAKIEDRKKLILKEPLLVKLLELNDQYDTAKLALDETMLYARIDVAPRILDEQELKALIEQIASVADLTYPQLKSFTSP